MLEMRVKGICRCPKHPDPSLLLEDAAGERVLAIGIPPVEAERIASEVRGTPVGEPSIFLALLEVLRFVRAQGPTVWLDLRGRELVGAVGLAVAGREIIIRCAPREAAVLAAVAHVSVRIGVALARDIEAAQPNAEDRSEECGKSIAEWLDRIRPEDFR